MKENLKLHCFGNQFNVFYDVIKNGFNMSNNNIFNNIQNDFMKLESKLNEYSIDYMDLKSALIPPDGKKHFDFLFVFDYSKCDDNCLGMSVYEKLLNILQNDNFKKSSTSIFSGDLLPYYRGYKEMCDYINKDSKKKVSPYKSDYFVVLMSHLTQNQSKEINELFKYEDYYITFTDITFKNDLAKANLLLPSVGLKTKDKFIMLVPEEGEKRFFSKFLPKGLKAVYIVDYLFESFLQYNYYTTVYDKNEDFTNYILNPNSAEKFKKYSLVVDEVKYYNYLTSNKSYVPKLLCDEQTNNIDNFKKIVWESLSNNIFNVVLDTYGVRFNTLIDIDNHRLFFSFEYLSEKKEIRLITAY